MEDGQSVFEISCNNAVAGSIRIVQPYNYLALCEVEAFGVPTDEEALENVATGTSWKIFIFRLAAGCTLKLSKISKLHIDIFFWKSGTQFMIKIHLHFIINTKTIKIESVKLKVILNLSGKPTWQSSMGWGGVPSRATDGDINGIWSMKSCIHSANKHFNMWKVRTDRVVDIFTIIVL